MQSWIEDADPILFGDRNESNPGVVGEHQRTRIEAQLIERQREEREEKRDRFLKTCVGLMTIFGGLPLAIEIYKALHH